MKDHCDCASGSMGNAYGSPDHRLLLVRRSQISYVSPDQSGTPDVCCVVCGTFVPS